MSIIKTNRFNKCLLLRAMPLVDCAFGVTLGHLGMGPRAELDVGLTSQVLWVGNYSNKNILAAEWTHQALIALLLSLLWSYMTTNKSHKMFLQNFLTGPTCTLKTKMSSLQLRVQKTSFNHQQECHHCVVARGESLSIWLLRWGRLWSKV